FICSSVHPPAPHSFPTRRSSDLQQPGCGRPMTRIGEEVTERLDIVPAEFFVHRHVYGKWACRCCQVLKQAPAAPELIEGGIAARDRKSTRLNSSHVAISYAVFCL